MSFATLFSMLGPAVGTGLGVALAVMGLGLLSLWKFRWRERSVGALMPWALAAGFVAGYAMLFDLPMKWDDEIWKWVAVSAAAAGLLLALANLLPRNIDWVVWPLLVAAVSWLTARRIPQDRWYYMAALAGALILYLAAYRPVTRDGRLWMVGSGVMLVCGVAAVAILMPFELNHGRLLFLLTSLVGLNLLAGFVPPLRMMSAGGAAFPAVVLAVLATTAAFYMVPETYPRIVLWWLAAAPLGAAVAWVPWLTKRPWLCALAALAVTAALLVPAILNAWWNAPPMDA